MISPTGENPIDNDQLTQPKVDLYACLGIEPTANDKEVLAAYERLAIQYQTTNSPEEVETCRNINQAFFILSNPSSRKHYDETGEMVQPKNDNRVEQPPGSMDVSNLGGIGRVFGAVISRIGIPIQTQISQEVLNSAQEICRNGGLQGGASPSDPRLTDFFWGWGIESKVDRQAGTFFRLTIEEKHVENGFILYCRSPSKGKFKLIIFDVDGNIIFQEACVKSRDGGVTHSSLYFTKFTTYRLGEPIPNHLRETDIPQLFSKLDNYVPNTQSIVPGQYLVCIYGDNFLGKTNFALLALYAKNDCAEVADIQEIDEKLRVTKEMLETFRVDFVKARETYEKAVRRLEEESRNLEDLLDRREEAYRGFLSASAKANTSDSISPPTAVKATVSSSPLETIGDATGAAAAAGGWLARGIASGMGQLSKIVTNVGKSNSTDESEEGSQKLKTETEENAVEPECSISSSAAVDVVDGAGECAINDKDISLGKEGKAVEKSSVDVKPVKNEVEGESDMVNV
mmetsp:Transcript_24895/g.25115  ORF Transcript_24895/g.25115 Transcript_24895/m.25115 type:complete len:514 (+) Transcript_24895:100-1641(+)|eukprot:CAMPEP_0182416472 /NCGR_PEP_ID=MMETSP1167-20130531/769_1 /TAXON_ID=2988 /ORGANISM="Mallomonas Sp, Strain CCMP3275" /LENGTH=513 /DNA_ID=CAMNT_0024589255 /DNA_START=68 /DNA_END=1609 /DNA_ORIENTATION=+